MFRSNKTFVKGCQRRFLFLPRLIILSLCFVLIGHKEKTPSTYFSKNCEEIVLSFIIKNVIFNKVLCFNFVCIFLHNKQYNKFLHNKYFGTAITATFSRRFMQVSNIMCPDRCKTARSKQH